MLLAAVAFLPLLTARDLWHSDEPRYAQVAREMLDAGDPVLPRLNGEAYLEKPPLLFWLQAAFGRWSGDVGPLAARLPSALGGIAGVGLTVLLAVRLRLAAHATLAGVMLATTFGWWWLSQRAAFDALLGAFVVAALLCEEIALARERGGARSAALRARLLGAACLGLGFLTKGPPVLIFGLAGRLARAWAARRSGVASPAVRPLARIASGAAQVVVFAAVAAVWLAPLVQRLGLERLLDNLEFQTAGRMGGEAPHAKGPWYYLGAFPVDALPWSLAWPVAAIAAWRARRRAAPAGTPAAADAAFPAEARRFLLAFVLAVLCVFSLIRGKRSLYLTPLLPFTALLTAPLVARLAGGGARARRTLVRAAAAWGLLLALGGRILLQRIDRGGALGPFSLAAQSPRPLGAAVAGCTDDDDEVFAVSLRHHESLLYFTAAERRERGLPPLRRFAAVDLPASAGDLAQSDLWRILRGDVARARPDAVVVCRPQDEGLLRDGFGGEIDLVARVLSDDDVYLLLRPR